MDNFEADQTLHMRGTMEHWETPDFHGLVCASEEKEGKKTDETSMAAQIMHSNLGINKWNKERSSKRPGLWC